MGTKTKKLTKKVRTEPQGSILGPFLFLLYNAKLFPILENKLISYADDSTLIAVVPPPGVRVTVAESLIRDLDRVSEWCDLWGMKLTESKTKTLMVSRLRTMHPQSPPLTIGGTVLKESDALLNREWHLFTKLHLRSIFALFLEQLLKDLASWGSPDECSMNFTSREILSWFCPASFGVLFCSVVLGCRYTP